MPDILPQLLRNGMMTVVFAAVTVLSVWFLRKNRQNLRRFPAAAACVLCGMQALASLCTGILMGLLWVEAVEPFAYARYLKLVTDIFDALKGLTIVGILVSLFGREPQEKAEEK